MGCIHNEYLSTQGHVTECLNYGVNFNTIENIVSFVKNIVVKFR